MKKLIFSTLLTVGFLVNAVAQTFTSCVNIGGVNYTLTATLTEPARDNAYFRGHRNVTVAVLGVGSATVDAILSGDGFVTTKRGVSQLLTVNEGFALQNGVLSGSVAVRLPGRATRQEYPVGCEVGTAPAAVNTAPGRTRPQPTQPAQPAPSRSETTTRSFYWNEATCQERLAYMRKHTAGKVSRATPYVETRVEVQRDKFETFKFDPLQILDDTPSRPGFDDICGAPAGVTDDYVIDTTPASPPPPPKPAPPKEVEAPHFVWQMGAVKKRAFRPDQITDPRLIVRFEGESYEIPFPGTHERGDLHGVGCDACTVGQEFIEKANQLYADGRYDDLHDHLESGS